MFYYHSADAVWQNGFAGLVEVKRNSKEVKLEMRVVFLEDVAGVARGGDVKEVKNGFARNYLIPKNLAVPANHNALQRVEKLSRSAGVSRVRLLDDMKQLAEAIEGTQIDIEMRAGSGGRLYGSVTNTIIAESLSELTDKEIDRRTIEIPEPIRDLGIYDLIVRLHPEVDTNIKVVVHDAGVDPLEMIQAAEARALAEEEQAQREEEAKAEMEADASEAAKSQAADEPASEDEEE